MYQPISESGRPNHSIVALRREARHHCGVWHQPTLAALILALGIGGTALADVRGRIGYEQDLRVWHEKEYEEGYWDPHPGEKWVPTSSASWFYAESRSTTIGGILEVSAETDISPYGFSYFVSRLPVIEWSTINTDMLGYQQTNAFYMREDAVIGPDTVVRSYPGGGFSTPVIAVTASYEKLPTHEVVWFASFTTPIISVGRSSTGATTLSLPVIPGLASAGVAIRDLHDDIWHAAQADASGGDFTLTVWVSANGSTYQVASGESLDELFFDRWHLYDYPWDVHTTWRVRTRTFSQRWGYVYGSGGEVVFPWDRAGGTVHSY